MARTAELRALRTVVFFLWFLGFGLGLPALVLGLLMRNTQPPFAVDRDAGAVLDGRFKDAIRLLGPGLAVRPVDARAQFPGMMAAAAGVYDDGTRVLIARGADAAAAKSALAAFYGAIKTGHATAEHDGTRFVATTGETAWVARQDEFAIAVFGPTSEAVAARRAAVTGFRDSPERTVGNKLGREYMPYGLAALLVWCVIVALMFGRMASWAGGADSAAGVAPIPAAELREKLLALNERNLPFTVAPGDSPDELVVDWRYADQRWTDLMSARGMQRSHRLVLRLDEASHKLRSRDYEASLDWSARVDGASLAWKGGLGVTLLKYDYERAYGLFFEDGALKLVPRYEYRFDLDEMKAPIVALAVGSGWRWRPVVSFWRPLGG